jgi:hypothetical protein
MAGTDRSGPAAAAGGIIESMDTEHVEQRSDHDAMRAAAHRRERIREGVTMALYISLSLLAVMLAVPREDGPSSAQSPALVIGLTAIGLILAHQLASRLSTRLAHHGRLAREHLDLFAAQLIGGLIVTVVAVIPVILIPNYRGVIVSELVLLAFIASVAYSAARLVPFGRLRSLTYAAGIVVIALAVLWVKGLVDH